MDASGVLSRSGFLPKLRSHWVLCRRNLARQRLLPRCSFKSPERETVIPETIAKLVLLLGVVLLVVAIGIRARREQPLDRSSRPDAAPRYSENAPPNS